MSQTRASRADLTARPRHRHRRQRAGGRDGRQPTDHGRRSPDRRDRVQDIGRTGGADGNARLTALTGATLLVLFAAEGLTIASVHGLLTMHFFVGMLLVGPVLLKISSTCYRFARYYAGAAPYVRKGPPAPLLRLLGPVVVLTSCGVLGTGIMLAVTGPGAGPWLFLHKALFVLWFGAMTIHVLAYAPRLARLAAASGRGLAAGAGAGPPGRAHIAVGGPAGGGPADGGPAVRGSAARWLLLAASLGGGLLLAALTIRLAAAWHGQNAAAALTMLPHR